MATFQILSAYVNIGGSRDNVVFRGPDNPITYPEMLVLQRLHGGEEHVFGALELGRKERDMDVEGTRLTERYGKAVAEVFPRMGSRYQLPTHAEGIATVEEEAAATAAAEAAKAKVRNKNKGKKPAPEPAPEPAATTDAAVPDVDALPTS